MKRRAKKEKKEKEQNYISANNTRASREKHKNVRMNRLTAVTTTKEVVQVLSRLPCVCECVSECVFN